MISLTGAKNGANNVNRQPTAASHTSKAKGKRADGRRRTSLTETAVAVLQMMISCVRVVSSLRQEEEEEEEKFVRGSVSGQKASISPFLLYLPPTHPVEATSSPKNVVAVQRRRRR